MGLRNRCDCGKVMSKYANSCKGCAAKRYAENNQKAIEHVTRGTCPYCGTALIRNLALTGWYQCGGYASQGFREKGFESVASCSFQCIAKF